MYAALRQAGDDDRRRCGALEPRRRRDCVPRRESRRVRARVARVRRGGAGLRAGPAIRKRAEEWEALCLQRSSAWRPSRRCSPQPAGPPMTARPPSWTPAGSRRCAISSECASSLRMPGLRLPLRCGRSFRERTTTPSSPPIARRSPTTGAGSRRMRPVVERESRCRERRLRPHAVARRGRGGSGRRLPDRARARGRGRDDRLGLAARRRPLRARPRPRRGVADERPRDVARARAARGGAERRRGEHERCAPSLPQGGNGAAPVLHDLGQATDG